MNDINYSFEYNNNHYEVMIDPSTITKSYDHTDNWGISELSIHSVRINDFIWHESAPYVKEVLEDQLIGLHQEELIELYEECLIEG